MGWPFHRRRLSSSGLHHSVWDRQIFQQHIHHHNSKTSLRYCALTFTRATTNFCVFVLNPCSVPAEYFYYNRRNFCTHKNFVLWRLWTSVRYKFLYSSEGSVHTLVHMDGFRMLINFVLSAKSTKKPKLKSRMKIYAIWYCNRRNFRMQFNFVFSYFWPKVQILQHTTIHIRVYTYSECDTALAVRKFIAYESPLTLDYDTKLVPYKNFCDYRKSPTFVC